MKTLRIDKTIKVLLTDDVSGAIRLLEGMNPHRGVISFKGNTIELKSTDLDISTEAIAFIINVILDKLRLFLVYKRPECRDDWDYESKEHLLLKGFNHRLLTGSKLEIYYTSIKVLLEVSTFYAQIQDENLPYQKRGNVIQ